MTQDYTVYIGTYTDPILFGTGKVLYGKGKGIYIYRMDSVSGSMKFISTTRDTTNPSYLALGADNRSLYAVNELKTYRDEPTGTVSAFTVDSDTKQLTFLNKKPTHGTDPCHLTVDKTGKFVLLANFMSGSVCVLPIQADGSLGDVSDFIQHRGSSIDPDRQQGPHAHAVTLDDTNRYAFVPDLGLDKLLVYKFDAKSGKLSPNQTAWSSVKPGAGPRHLVFHPSSAYAYLINELDSTVTAYRFDGDNGILQDIQTISTLPMGYKGVSTCADLQVARSGKFLYGSNRGHDSIVMFKIDPPTGRLNCIGHQSTQGNTPRNFAIDPGGNFLLAANQDSDTIVTFRIDSHSGLLQPTGQITEVPTPVCIKII